MKNYFIDLLNIMSWPFFFVFFHYFFFEIILELSIWNSFYIWVFVLYLFLELKEYLEIKTKKWK